MITNALQLSGDSSAIGAKLAAGAIERGGHAVAAARVATFPLGACTVGLSWLQVASGLVLISYQLDDSCGELAELAEQEIDRMLAKSAPGGASWQTPALLALLVLGAAFLVWYRGKS